MTLTSLRSSASRRRAASLPAKTAEPAEPSTPCGTAIADPTAGGPAPLETNDYAPISATNPLGWDLRAVHITRYGPDQRGILRQYADDPRANNNPALVGLAGLLLGVDIVPAGADQPHGGRLYLAIDLQGQLPEQINQLRLRIGTGPNDCNWPVRTALHGLIAGEFASGDEVGLSTRPGKSIFFVDVLRASGRAVIPSRGYWGSSESIGSSPLEILQATNTLRLRLGQSLLEPSVFGELLEDSARGIAALERQVESIGAAR